jgi:hypothetical protein
MLIQTLKITGAGTVLAHFTAATIALGTTMFQDIKNFNQASPFESTSKLLEKFGNFSKYASEFFFSGSKDILNESGSMVKTVLFDGVGGIANGVKSFVGLGNPAPEVNLNYAQPPLLANSPTTTVGVAQAATPVVYTATPVSSQPVFSPAEASAKLSTLINGNQTFKKAVDSSGDIKLTLSDLEQKHIISLAEKITKVSGTNFTDAIPSLVSLKFCEVTSTSTIAKFSTIQKYAEYIDKGGDLEKAEMKLTNKVTESETAGYIIWEKVFKIIPAEKSILCSLYEQVKTTAEYQNIFPAEGVKADYCHAEPSSVLCADMFSDLFVAS